jgi:hypothetical protein
MDLNDLKPLSLFVDNQCWQKVNTYFSTPTIEHISLENIFNKIQYYLKRYKIQEYKFLGFCNIDLHLLEQLCNLIIRHKLNIRWSAEAIINTDMKEATFKKMRQAGCEKITFEIITGSDNLLNEMKLNFTTKDISLLLGLAHQNDLIAGINLILGSPLETDQNYNETLEFLTKNISVIDEITKVTYCLSNYCQKEALPFAVPFCKHWNRCLGLKQNDNIGFLEKDHRSYLSGIIKLGIPIVNIEPSPHILDYVKNLVEPYSLKRKELSFLFDNGKGRLFWKNQELTKGLGLYTSIFSSGSWQDSEHANWQIIKVNEENLILQGKWQALPIIQVWEIRLTEDRAISLRIGMKLLEDMIIEGEQQTNVMLVNEYESWSIDDGPCYSFPNLFNEEWPTLFEKRTDEIKSVSAITATHRLPSVSLKCNKSDADYRLGILNTSSCFCARKLKCYKIGKRGKRYTPGEYLYFNGRIEVNP